MSKRYCIIPARGGSRRIPGKNKRLFDGKPIICRAIDTAMESGMFHQVVVSTDDDQIRALAANRGCRIHLRGVLEARDEMGTQEVTRKVLLDLQVPPRNMVCCLYPTTPLLYPDDLRAGARLLERAGPVWSMSVGAEPLRDAGCFYWGRAESFYKGTPLIGPNTGMVVLPESRVCDINTEEDWQEALRKYKELTA